MVQWSIYNFIGSCEQEPPVQQAAHCKLVGEAIARLGGAADPLLPSDGGAAWRSLAYSAQDIGLFQVKSKKVKRAAQ